MHTRQPGSPFSVIISPPHEVTKSDIEECAVFTACFSQTWKSGKKNAAVHVFDAAMLHKSGTMKAGTWGVNGTVAEIDAPLELVLTVQQGILRAVPEKSVKAKKNILRKLLPGKIDKSDIVPKLVIELEGAFSQAEILSALPAGGLRVLK